MKESFKSKRAELRLILMKTALEIKILKDQSFLKVLIKSLEEHKTCPQEFHNLFCQNLDQIVDLKE